MICEIISVNELNGEGKTALIIKGDKTYFFGIADGGHHGLIKGAPSDFSKLEKLETYFYKTKRETECNHKNSFKVKPPGGSFPLTFPSTKGFFRFCLIAKSKNLEYLKILEVAERI